MDVGQKIQTVLNVIDGKVPQSVLKPILDDEEGHGVNVIKAAVDHIVGQVLQRQSIRGKAEFRFKFIENGRESFTEWIPEGSQFDASMKAGQIRKEHPHAAIEIERRY